MYNRTKQRLMEDLNIIHLIRNIRNQKIIVQNFHLTEEIENQMKHHEFNLLNLEDTSDYESEGPSYELKIDYN